MMTGVKTEQNKKKEKFSVCVPTLLPLWVLLYWSPSLSLWRKVGKESGNIEGCVYIPQANFMAHLCRDSKEINHKV